MRLSARIQHVRDDGTGGYFRGQSRCLIGYDKAANPTCGLHELRNAYRERFPLTCES